MSALAGIKALAFDVFGTVVDWREGVAREARRLVPGVDAHDLADRWRAGYQPAMEAVRAAQRPWVNLDVLNREILDEIQPGLSPGVAAELTLAWHRLDPWPDVLAGMDRLRRRLTLVPVSNGHIALVVGLSRRADLRWDAVLGAEVSQGYKPQAKVYDDAARLLALEPAQVAMVAAHPMDLHAAAARGLRAIYVHRPDEFGHGADRKRPPPHHFDLQADSFEDLAAKLGL